MVNNVKFKRFYGNLSEWNSRMISPKTYGYENSIVFAQVWDETNNVNYKIWAGSTKNPLTGETVNYLYNIPTDQKWQDVENLLLLLARDNNNNFTHSDMRNALENYINDSLTIQNIKNDIVEILQTLKWENREE